jgi:hypothetical protein
MNTSLGWHDVRIDQSRSEPPLNLHLYQRLEGLTALFPPCVEDFNGGCLLSTPHSWWKQWKSHNTRSSCATSRNSCNFGRTFSRPSTMRSLALLFRLTLCCMRVKRPSSGLCTVETQATYDLLPECEEALVRSGCSGDTGDLPSVA